MSAPIHLGCIPDDDPPWDELDDGIRETVRWLHGERFTTTDSGDGKLQGWKADMAEAIDVPHVFMVCAPDEMIQEADRLGRAVVARWLVGDEVRIEATYFPLGGIGVIQLFGVDDAMLAAADAVGAGVTS